MKRIAVLMSICGMCLTAQAAPFDCNSFIGADQKESAAQLTDIGLATVNGVDKVIFSKCAEMTCRTKEATRQYLVAGDVVVTGVHREGWVCALYPNKLGGTANWLPEKRLTAMPVAPTPPLAAWAGKWQMHDDANIEIKVVGGSLSVHGQAFWTGDNPANIHDGEISGTAKPLHGLLSLREPDADEYDCAADLRLVGPYLLVEDNGRCGGLNVSFTGAYRRK